MAPFAMLLFVRAEEVLEDRLATGPRIWAKLWAAAIAPLFLSVSLYGKAAFLGVGLSPDRPVGTHGPRGWTTLTLWAGGNGRWLILAKSLSAGLEDQKYRLIDALKDKDAAQTCSVEAIAEPEHTS